MKFYFSPGTCSLATHIILQEIGINYEKEQVNLKEHQTLHGHNYFSINRKGYVPALELDNNELLTEGVVIMQYLADLYPNKKLISPFGTIERYREMEMLNFISTEIHKGFTPLFHSHKAISSKESLDQLHNHIKSKLGQRFDLLEEIVKKSEFIIHEQFSVCDAYLFTTLSWTQFVDIDLKLWPSLYSYFMKLMSRESIEKAISIEKLKMNFK